MAAQFLQPALRSDGVNQYTPLNPPKRELSIFDWLGACCSEQPAGKEDYHLRAREELIMGDLQQEVLVPFTPGCAEHEAILLEYFKAVMPALSPENSTGPPGRRDERWKELGFQDQDPRTDFRGGGLLSLKCMQRMASLDSKRVCQMIRESTMGETPADFYPFAAAVINVCFRLAGWFMLDVRRNKLKVNAEDVCDGIEYRRFAELTLAEPETFLILCASAVVATHEEWCSRRHSVFGFSKCVDAAMTRVSLFLSQTSKEPPSAAVHKLRQNWRLPTTW
mmetsp:Transcript_66793/g.157299  ORF Transcript_66793/g.157299 Transcript_66793/m.157299 type:complete len:279 (+) Transcript_66793:62-898(+)